MFRFKPVVAGTTALLVAGSLVPAVAANADPVDRAAEGASSTQSVRQIFNDLDVVAFLTTGSGPIAEAHPQLTPFVPSVDQSPTRGELKTTLAEIREVLPDFHSKVTDRFQSGDPYLAAAALKAYGHVVSELASHNGIHEVGTGDGKCAVVVVGAVLVAVWAAVYLWPKTADGAIGLQEFAAESAAAFSR